MHFIPLVCLYLWGVFQTTILWSQISCAEDIFELYVEKWGPQLEKNNSEVQVSQASLRSAQALQSSAYSNFYPKLSGKVDYTQVGGSGSHFSTGSTVSDTEATAILSYNLYSGGSDLSKVRQAEANTASAQAAHDRVLAQAYYNLRSTTTQWVYSVQLEKLRQINLKRSQENLRLVELQFLQGGENRGSLLLSQANQKKSEFLLVQSQNAKAQALRDLQKILGGEDSISTPPGDLDDFPKTSPLSINKFRRENFRTLVLDTPAHREALAALRVAEANLLIARSAYFPSLDFNMTSLLASGGSSSSSSGLTIASSLQDRWTLGVTLLIPLFSGGKDYFTVRSAAANSAGSQAAQISIDLQTLSDLHRSYDAYSEAFGKVDVEKSFQIAAQKRAEIARSKYNNGLANFDDWNLIESDLVQREENLLISKRDLSLARASWIQTLGEVKGEK